MLPKIPEGVGNALDTTTKAAKEFLGKLLGPASEEAGFLLGDQVRFLRFKREVRILNDAKEFLQQNGIEPQSVPLKTLAPILESGSLEEDETMLKRWSALLATAADPNRGKNVQSSFPEILNQLSPLEAKMLDLIFDMINEKGISRREWTSRGAVGEGLCTFLKISEQDFEIAIDNLYRLRLCSPPSTGLDFIDNKNHRFQLSTKELICITSLGYAFVSACKIPITSESNRSASSPVIASKSSFDVPSFRCTRLRLD